MQGLLVAVVVLLSGVAFGAVAAEGRANQKGKPAYFVFRDATRTNEFVIRLKSPAQIRHARALLAGTTTERRHVGGIIIKRPAAYNPRWSYHLAPKSIEFFDFAAEVCDANMLYVQQHLSQVGGAFLPGNRWCPWSSTLVREIPRRDAAPRIPLSPFRPAR
jgi:hypothetical protein